METLETLKKKGYTDQTNSNKSGQEQIDREMKEHITQIRISMETETSLGNRLRTIIDLIGNAGRGEEAADAIILKEYKE